MTVDRSPDYLAGLARELCKLPRDVVNALADEGDAVEEETVTIEGAPDE